MEQYRIYISIILNQSAEHMERKFWKYKIQNSLVENSFPKQKKIGAKIK